MVARRADIVRRVWTELEAEVASQGFELVEVEFGQHGATQLLRLFVDRPGGVTLDHCVALSRYLSPLLDMKDFLSGRYTLEVSSPGIDRPIRKPADFQRFTGEPIKVKTVNPVDGRKRFRGVLRGIEDGLISVESEGRSHRIHIENVNKAQLDR